MGAVDRLFVGWDRSAIGLAAERLVSKYGPDMSGVVVALPGARAGRSLLDALVSAQSADWRPPRIMTTAGLTDEFVRLERPTASRLVRTRAWEHALRALAPGEITALMLRRPGGDDGKTWRTLAAEVRSLFATVSAECKDFGSVRDAMSSRSDYEQQRWQALVRVQELAEEFLRNAGQCDPHRGRLAALERGDLVDAGREVVLVGVVEAIGLVRRLVASLENVSALVFAPEAEREAFDAMGCLIPAAWLERGWTLPLDRWRIAAGPDDQARVMSGIISGWKGRYAAEKITIGVVDAEVTPFVERRLTEQGVFVRDARGSGHHATPPARLLAGVAAYLRHARFTDLAALVRHPDVEDHLAAASRDPDVGSDPGAAADVEPPGFAQALDAYHGAHLPGRLPEPWLCDERERDAARDQLAGRIGAAVEQWLAPLGGGERPTSQWVGPVRDVLRAVYGARVFDEGQAADRLVRAGLGGLGDALAGIENLPASADTSCSGGDALELVLEEAAAQRIPPPAPTDEQPTVELLGWLELAFDTAPALVVTGFNEGFLPEVVPTDAWLPDTLRVELGLPNAQARLGRDLFTLEWITRSREQASLVSGRRSLDGDPLRPSRLAFRGSPTEVLACVRHFLAETPPPVVQTESVLPSRELALPKVMSPPRSWSATAFASYLRSPYVFALERLAKPGLRTLDDRAQEMGPPLFGTVGHAVLHRFASSDCVDSTDPDAISAFLARALEQECASRFGDAPLPAVQLQRRQLAWRLGLFARDQAARVADGWRIEKAEWTPGMAVTLDVDGEAIALSGQIDRIDRHQDGRWAILDYKFSERATAPEWAHQRRGQWTSLQLPLYAYLARQMIGDAMPQLGYWSLGATAADCGVRIAKKWDAAVIDEALEKARAVVRAVRAQFADGASTFDLGQPYLFDPIMAAVCGDGLLAMADEGADA